MKLMYLNFPHRQFSCIKLHPCTHVNVSPSGSNLLLMEVVHLRTAPALPCPADLLAADMGTGPNLHVAGRAVLVAGHLHSSHMETGSVQNSWPHGDWVPQQSWLLISKHLGCSSPGCSDSSPSYVGIGMGPNPHIAGRQLPLQPAKLPLPVSGLSQEQVTSPQLPGLIRNKLLPVSVYTSTTVQ